MESIQLQWLSALSPETLVLKHCLVLSHHCYSGSAAWGWLAIQASCTVTWDHYRHCWRCPKISALASLMRPFQLHLTSEDFTGVSENALKVRTLHWSLPRSVGSPPFFPNSLGNFQSMVNCVLEPVRTFQIKQLGEGRPVTQRFGQWCKDLAPFGPLYLLF